MKATQMLTIIATILVVTNAMPYETEFNEHAKETRVLRNSCTSRVDVELNGVMKTFRGCKSSELTMYVVLTHCVYRDFFSLWCSLR